MFGKIGLLSLLFGCAVTLTSFHGRSTVDGRTTARPVPKEFFGLTLNHPLETPWPAFPVSAIRTWDASVSWADISPQKGTYNWSRLDAIFELAEKRSVDIVFTFGRTPQWASSKPHERTHYGPGQCAPPKDLDDWDDFIKAVSDRAKGKIRFWEVWNEPQEDAFYCGSVQTMVELQRRAFAIIKGRDASHFVLTPSPVGGHGPQWMNRFLSLGGGNYADIVAFHGYWDSKPESIVSVVARFRKAMTSYGIQKKPLWNTEGGWGRTADLPDQRLQAAFLARTYLLQWSLGIERFFWYSYDNGLGWGTLWQKEGGQSMAGGAYGIIQEWMVGAAMELPCAAVSGVWRCGLRRPGGSEAVIVWKEGSTPGEFVVDEKFSSYRDILGNAGNLESRVLKVTGIPIMLETRDAGR